MKVMEAVQVLIHLLSDEREGDCRCGNIDLTKEEKKAIRIATDYLEEMS